MEEAHGQSLSNCYQFAQQMLQSSQYNDNTLRMLNLCLELNESTLIEQKLMNIEFILQCMNELGKDTTEVEHWKIQLRKVRESTDTHSEYNTSTEKYTATDDAELRKLFSGVTSQEQAEKSLHHTFNLLSRKNLRDERILDLLVNISLTSIETVQSKYQIDINQSKIQCLHEMNKDDALVSQSQILDCRLQVLQACRKKPVFNSIVFEQISVIIEHHINDATIEQLSVFFDVFSENIEELWSNSQVSWLDELLSGIYLRFVKHAKTNTTRFPVTQFATIQKQYDHCFKIRQFHMISAEEIEIITTILNADILLDRTVYNILFLTPIMELERELELDYDVLDRSITRHFSSLLTLSDSEVNIGRAFFTWRTHLCQSKQIQWSMEQEYLQTMFRKSPLHKDISELLIDQSVKDEKTNWYLKQTLNTTGYISEKLTKLNDQIHQDQWKLKNHLMSTRQELIEMLEEETKQNNKVQQKQQESIDHLQNEVNDLKQQQQAMIEQNIKLTKELQYLSQRLQASPSVLYYTSDFDQRGLFGWIGTQELYTEYSNPIASKKIITTQSGQLHGDVNSIAEKSIGKDTICYIEPPEKGQKIAWICFDFIQYSIQPQYYTLRHDSSPDGQLRFWKIQGSNDKIKWIKLKSHKKDKELDGPLSCASWNLHARESFRYIRILQARKNSSDSFELHLAGFEVYGVVSRNKYIKQ
jgi:hypothetical protein